MFSPVLVALPPNGLLFLAAAAIVVRVLISRPGPRAASVQRPRLFRRAILAGAALALALLSQLLHAEDGAFLQALRAQAAAFPLLEPGARPGAPRFVVHRLNAPPLLHGGQRFGAVRIVCPPGAPRPLAWLFSDTTNIDEYGLLSPAGERLEAAAVRLIYPATASADPDEDRAGPQASPLPRPWDFVQLHLLAVPAHQLQPGAEYILWFRFDDQRPTDLLLAAIFPDAAPALDPPALPRLFALPALREP